MRPAIGVERVGDPGYSIHPHVFAHADMVSVIGALGQAEVVRTKAGARHVMTLPVVRELAADRRSERASRTERRVTRS